MRTWTNPYYLPTWQSFWQQLKRQSRHERKNKLLDCINNTNETFTWLYATAGPIGASLTIMDNYDGVTLH